MQATRSHDLSIRMQARRVLQLSLASLALAGTGAAWAADPAPPKVAQAGTTDKAAAEAAFVRADADKDGKLSKAEAGGLPAIAQRFDELDKDKDGTLSMPEYMAAFGATR